MSDFSLREVVKKLKGGSCRYPPGPSNKTNWKWKYKITPFLPLRHSRFSLFFGAHLVAHVQSFFWKDHYFQQDLLGREACEELVL